MHTREVAIDLVKILASFAVICLHVIDIPTTLTEQVIYYLSGCAIPLLFMTNGYLLLNKKKITFKRQLKKSLNMLGIVFAWCALFSCLYYITDKVWINPIESTLESLLQEGPMWQFWFIGSLIIIHLFLPVLHKIFQRKKYAFILTLLGVLICFGTDVVNVLFVTIDQPLIQSNVPQTFRLWNHFTYFFIGGFLGNPEIRNAIINKVKMWKHVVLLVIFSFIIVIYQINMGASYYGTTYAEFFYDNFFIMAWNIVLFTCFFTIHVKNIKWSRFIEYISINTFGVYSMHLYLLGILRMFFDYRPENFNIWIPILIFAVGQLISTLLRSNKVTGVLVTF